MYKTDNSTVHRRAEMLMQYNQVKMLTKLFIIIINDL